MTPDSSKRPLSPHLQIYRLPMAAILSITHRITGAGLAIGLLMLTWWLVAAALGEGAYDIFSGFIESWLGTFMLFGWTLALFFHLFNGIRHLVWDTGRGVEIKSVNFSGCVVLVLSLLATIAIWYDAYN